MNKFLASITMSIIVLLGATATVSASSYEVVKGDNLWDIAIENNTTMQHLMEVNQLDSTIIQPNQVISITEPYIVVKGDTLIAIGKQFDVTVDEIMDWNDLNSSLILIGQELTIKESQFVNGKEVVADQSNDKINPTPSVAPEVVKPKVTKNTANTPVKAANKAAASRPAQETQLAGKTITVKATAYTAECEGCSGITYTGVDLNKDRNAKVIAVDPTVIPLGSEVYVEGYGHAIAADIGSAIKGNRIDIHLPTKKEAFSWGVRNVNITIISK